jgi:hypothetical protein
MPGVSPLLLGRMAFSTDGDELSQVILLPFTPYEASGLSADITSNCGIKLVAANEMTVIAGFHRAQHITKKRKV